MSLDPDFEMGPAGLELRTLTEARRELRDELRTVVDSPRAANLVGIIERLIEAKFTELDRRKTQ